MSTRDGLASNKVLSILHDQKGFTWIGTANGLQRFDGRKLIGFRPPAGSRSHLPATNINKIYQYDSNTFIVQADNDIGLFDPATFSYNRSKITFTSATPPRNVNQFYRDSRGNFFLVVSGHTQILVHDKKSNSFVPDFNCIRAPGNWPLRAIIEDPVTGNYWMRSDSGLAMYDIKTRQVYSRVNNPLNLQIFKTAFAAKPVSAFFIDRKHRFWVVTWHVKAGEGQRYYCFDMKSCKLLSDAASLKPNDSAAYSTLTEFNEFSNDVLVVYGVQSLFFYDSVKHRFNFLRDRNTEDYGIRYDQVYCAYEDREQNIWLGTNEGVYVINPANQFFTNIRQLDTAFKQDLEVTAFLQASDKRIFVCTWGGGMLVYDSLFRRLPNPITPRQDVAMYKMQWDLCQAKKSGKIWIACQEGRIIIHDPATQKSDYYNLPVLKGKTARQILEDKNGNIWMATHNGVLVKWDPTAGYGSRFLTGFSQMGNFGTIIYEMTEDKEGFLWLATYAKGLYRFDPSTNKIAAHFDSQGDEGYTLYRDVVSDIVQYNDSLFYIACGTVNLLNIKTGRISRITEDDGLPSLTANRLVLDDEGNLWIGILSGICRFDQKRKIITVFGSKDGIVESYFPAGVTGKLPNGIVLFGTSHDFIFCNPRTLVRNTAPPNVTITDFKLLDTYLPIDSVMNLKVLNLDHFQNSIVIGFASLSFLQRDKMVYYYQLEGIDSKWIRAERFQFVNYTLLPPGRYRFKVKCENANGIQSQNYTSVLLYIRPPWFKTWWFISLVVLTVSGTVYLIYRLRVNHLLAMVNVRSRIARDLHDDVGSTLSTINILSEMARQRYIGNTPKAIEVLTKIGDNSSRMMEAMDDIVWSINPNNDSMKVIAARMREFCNNVLEAKDIHYTFRIQSEVEILKLDMESRRDLFLIFKEAVNNLAKYSNARNAIIEISIRKRELHMIIQDDGIGFDINSIDDGNGLINMQKRANTMNGRLHIESVLGLGTKINLRVIIT